LSRGRGKTRVIYFTQFFYPLTYGGGEYLIYMLAREMVRRGHEVHVITQRVHGAPSSEGVDGISVHRVGLKMPYGGALPSGLLSNLSFFVSSLIAGVRLMAGYRTLGRTLVHSNTYVPSLSGAACARIFRSPHVITFHDVYRRSSAAFWEAWKRESGSRFPSFSAVVARFLEATVLNLKPSVFHAVSESTRDDLIGCGVEPRCLAVVPNGIDELDYPAAPPPPPGRPEVVFVGRLVFYKNLETILAAMAKLSHEVPEVRLYVVGDGPHRRALEGLAASLHVNVIFAGWVRQEDKLRLISRSLFMVFPSLMEGFGISMIEGFASARSVLASDVRPMSDIITDGREGFLVSPFDAGAWAAKMASLFRDPLKAAEMGRDAYTTYRSTYTMGAVANRMEALYESMLT
jgi:glycosyltransferase involved in cell wall biosynthesis